MKLRIILLLSLLILPIGAIALGQGEAPESWEIVGEGIEYQKFHLSNPVPVDVFVARMDRNNPNTTIESSIGQGRLTGGRETVSNMSDRYEGALNYWGPPTIPVTPTWGSTNNVVVAINGYYFDYETGIPQRGQVHSGWYAKRFDDNENGSGFIWKMDRSVFMGACISHPNDKQYVHVDSETQIWIDDVNVSRNDDELILYTPQYDRDTETDNSGTEVLVEMLAPTYISIASNMPVGVVRQIRQNQGSTPIPYDHVVLSGHGQKAQELEAANIQTGDLIGIAQRVVDCPLEPVVNDWTKAYAGVGGHWRFLRNGVIDPYSDDPQATVRDPRTAIAYNDQYIFFIVVDGRNPGVSEGMKVSELADFAKNTLGATYGIAQDGGGSSTMVINGEVVNNTYCNFTKCEPGELYVKVYIPIVTKQYNNQVSVPQAQPKLQAEWDEETQILQALVANGMLMVVVQPMDKSMEPYDPDDPVSTVGSVDVYLGPGTNYAKLNTVEGDGTIRAPLNELGGVYAKGSYWWKVKIGAYEGWVPEENIIPQLKLRRSDGIKAR
jgi:hypothetical protein